MRIPPELGPPIRGDFPFLERTINGHPVVYLDSAASTPSPKSVLVVGRECQESLVGNVNRGRHALAEDTTMAFDAARRRVARFLNADPNSVVFVRGATEGINLVARGLRLSKHDSVLVSIAEHHSNIAPWMREAQLKFLRTSPTGPIDPVDLANAIDLHRPKVFAVHHGANVTGVIQPVEALCRVAREKGVVTLVDASQSIPHLPIDVERIGCDFLAFSGHKMLGPKGVGVLWGRADMLDRLDALCVGGGAIESLTESRLVLRPPPEGLEAGTPNVSGAITLAAAMDYLEALGRNKVEEEAYAMSHLLREIVRNFSACSVLASTQEFSLPIVTIVPPTDGPSADRLAGMLSDGFGIMVRSGLHCAHPLFQELGAVKGAVRASAYLYNDEQDLLTFGRAWQELSDRFGP